MDEEPRRARILDGATAVFLAYGFQRATMDDIARAAELSRPALYLQFPNKTGIYRAIAACLFEEALERARQCLAFPGPLAERLDRLVDYGLHDLLKDILASPHGADLIDRKNSLAGDLVVAWRERMDEILDEAIRAEAERARIDLAARDLSPRLLAETFFDALEGMRVRLGDAAPQPAAAKRLVRVIAAAVAS